MSVSWLGRTLENVRIAFGEAVRKAGRIFAENPRFSRKQDEIRSILRNLSGKLDKRKFRLFLRENDDNSLFSIT